MTANVVWKNVFNNWPTGIPRRGMVISTLNEPMPFKGFMVKDDVVLLERTNPDALGARASWNLEPVHEPEDRGQQAACHAGRDQPVRDGRELRPAGDEVDHVEDHRAAQEPEREHDHHLVDRVTEQLGARLHNVFLRLERIGDDTALLTPRGEGDQLVCQRAPRDLARSDSC